MADPIKIPNVPMSQYYPWSTAEIQAVVAAEIAKIPTAPVNPPAGGFTNWTVKDWAQFASVVATLAAVFGFGTVGHLKQDVITTKVESVQQKQEVQEKTADDVKVALNTATNEQKKSFKAQSDATLAQMLVLAEAREVIAKEPDATAEEKKIATDARAAYQAHLDRLKSGH